MARIIHLKMTPRAMLEKYLEDADQIEEIMILAKSKDQGHRWNCTRLENTLWWIGFLEHAKAEMCIGAIMGPEE